MNPGWRNNYLRYKSYFLNVAGSYRERADIKVYLEILLSLATISVFSIFALRPTILTIAELIKDIEAKRETVTKMEEKIRNLSQAQSLYDRERAKIVILKSAIPEKAEALVFARQIEGLSEKHASTVLGITTDEALIKGVDPNIGTASNSKSSQSQEPFPEGAGGLTFSVNTSALPEEYRKIPNFLSDVEKFRRPVQIDYLSITIEEKEEQKTLVLTLEGRLPFFSLNK